MARGIRERDVKRQEAAVLASVTRAIRDHAATLPASSSIGRRLVRLGDDMAKAAAARKVPEGDRPQLMVLTGGAA